MDAYTNFASVYDMYMDNTPYEEWCERIQRIMREYDEKQIPEGDEALASEAGLVLDLGCGTGTLTRMLADKGYDCIGVDNSFDMLEIAREKEQNKSDENQTDGGQDNKEIMYLCQDMREFELYSTVGTVISVCDCINYLLEKEDILSTFKLVNNYLYPRGLFIFDFNTVHKYRDVIGDTTIAENREDGSFIWENYYDDESQINEYDLTIYQKVENNTCCESGSNNGCSESCSDGADRFIRFQETHVQRGYECEDIEELVRQAGMEIILVFDADTDEPVSEDTERVCIVAREITKNID